MGQFFLTVFREVLSFILAFFFLGVNCDPFEKLFMRNLLPLDYYTRVCHFQFRPKHNESMLNEVFRIRFIWTRSNSLASWWMSSGAGRGYSSCSRLKCLPAACLPCSRAWATTLKEYFKAFWKKWVGVRVLLHQNLRRNLWSSSPSALR